jgi:aspartate kinase
MDAFVAKFGGSTFTALDDYRRIADHLLEEVRGTGRKAAIVVSAMPGETEGLRERLAAVNPNPSYRGSAGLLTLADVISAYLLQEAVVSLGGTATVLNQFRHGIHTDKVWMSARIVGMDPRPVRTALENHDVVVIPGGPASDGTGNPTWMGKNSSDLAAVATAVNVGASEVSIHSDVYGVYSSDPNLVPEARVLPELSYSAATLLSARGAKVLHQRAVTLAAEHGIEIRCRGNRAPFESGTVITRNAADIRAVVVDLRSVLVEFADDATARAAYLALTEQGVHALLSDGRPALAVPGGFVDVPRHLTEAGIDFTPAQGRLVSEIHGPVATSHFASDDAEAIAIGKRLHANGRLLRSVS